MKTDRTIGLFTAAFLLFSWALTGTAARAQGLVADGYLEAELFVNDRFHILNDFFGSSDKRFDKDKTLHILYVNPAVSAGIDRWLSAAFEYESEIVYDHSHRDVSQAGEVRNAYIRVIPPRWEWITLRAGRQSLSTAQSYLYDDEAPALSIKADLEQGFTWPLKLEAHAIRVDRNSPYIHARLQYAFAFLESITFHFGWFHDTRNGVARIFNYLESDRIYTSKSRLQWYGVSLKKFIGNIFMHSTVLYEHGTVWLRHRDTGARAMRTSAYMVDLNFDYNINERLSLSLFCFISSGDDHPRKGTLRAFVSINPYIDKTNIFFNGGIDSQFSSDNVGLNGVQLSGVIAPGITAHYRPASDLYLKFVATYLVTHQGTGGHGHVYGWECDFMTYYTVCENLQLFMEYNFFKPGDYFKDLSNHQEHSATEMIVGFSYYFNI